MKKITALLTFASAWLMSGTAMAQGWGGGAGGATSDKAYFAMAAALAIGLPALGGAFGQGRTAASALESIGRNPNAADRLFVPMILGLALIESLVIYGFIIAILVYTKI